MKIKVRPARLLPPLASHAFIAGPELKSKDSFSFVRPARVPELFEWILVEAQGKQSEAVYAKVVTSLAFSILDRRSFGEERAVTGMPFEDEERGWSIVETQAAAREWEHHLVELAPLQAEQLTAECGEGLLRRTEEARCAAKCYLARLDFAKPLSAQIEELRPNADLKQLGVAERMAYSWPHCDEEIFALAWLCILSYEAEVEEHSQVVRHPESEL